MTKHFRWIRIEMKTEKPRFNCGLDAALYVIGGKWKPLILYHLAHDKRRYGALRRAVGAVSNKVLIQQLKELESDTVITRQDFQEVPPRVEYALTDFGRSLARTLLPLCQWGEAYMNDVKALAALHNDQASASPAVRAE